MLAGSSVCDQHTETDATKPALVSNNTRFAHHLTLGWQFRFRFATLE